MISVTELDAMPADRAAEVLADCCGAARWVSIMVARRPFESRGTLLSEAEETWASLDESDWREAFEHHPRIGAAMGTVPQGERGRTWSAGEQAGVEKAQSDLREALAVANREYEQRFGYIYIVCAAGKTAEQMLAIARERLRNDPDVEIGVAAEEQRKITHLRLEKVLDNGEAE